MNWTVIAAVACGGAVGSVGRYLTGVLMGRLLGSGFPWGTLTVNIVGAFLMGVLIEALALRFSVSQEFRAFAAVGVLGGFTTFSSFALDAAVLFQRGQMMISFLYVSGTLVAGLSALYLAIFLVRQIFAA
jgi:CrcB protein